MGEINLQNLPTIEKLHSDTEQAKLALETAKAENRSTEELLDLADKYNNCHLKESQYLTGLVAESI
jgi:hypothetical protein